MAESQTISDAIAAVLLDLPDQVLKLHSNSIPGMLLYSVSPFLSLSLPGHSLASIIHSYIIILRKLLSACTKLGRHFLGSSCFAAETFMLSIDNEIVNNYIISFTSAICLMFGSYYCFNVHYPVELRSTLEFLQRHHIRIVAHVDTLTRLNQARADLKVRQEKCTYLEEKLQKGTNNSHQSPEHGDHVRGQQSEEVATCMIELSKKEEALKLQFFQKEQQMEAWMSQRIISMQEEFHKKLLEEREEP
ncbi:hypothetical protein D4764_13G0011720, partial [Takifugu flavidus]